MRLRSFFKQLSSILLASPLVVYAATGADEIRTQVDQYMEKYQQELMQQYQGASRIEHKIMALDSRINMGGCDTPLSIERKDGSDIGRVTLKVSCDSPKRWTLFVPTHIKVMHPIVVSSSPINKKTRLKNHHLRLKDTDISRVRGSYYFHINDVINMEVKRQLKPGTVITSNHIRHPLMIEKGDVVVLSAQLGSLSVKTPAIALAAGRQGEQIRVQNKQTKRVVDARIIGPGVVKVIL
ncbi:MAG: flagella basal body P-ring formation protein FlgA [Pseudohongiellaceae bacterium]|jgi:flagella basal body P-ring formation protein FlgA